MTWIAALATCALVLPSRPAGEEPDADRDGLPDFQESHKYGTDPRNADSDGDGIPDGDWDERREYAYTVRTIVDVLPPVTRDVLQDDWQDARVLEEDAEHVQLEVVHYPFGTAGEAIEADPDWRAHVAARADLQPYLAPGVTANWDARMREELLAALARDGIDAATLDDKALVERASRWLFEQTRFEDGFTTYCSTFELADGKATARVLPGLEATAERGKTEASRSLDEQWQRELFAAGMWEHQVHGSCTSSAIFLSGCLRALGVPTRIVLFMPLVDGSDEREVSWLKTRLTHHEVRRIVRGAIEPLGGSWANHTFDEVFVGGRWRRLNYSKLGQGILDPHCFGLMTHVATFGDWADGEMARTWGLRQANERRSEDRFGGSNPYSCIALSDRFGAHSAVANPPAPEVAASKSERTLTLDAVGWSDAPEMPEWIRENQTDPPILLGHVERWDDFEEIRRFTTLGDARFFLEAEGQPTLAVDVGTGGITVRNGQQRDAWVILVIASPEVKAVARRTRYSLRPQNGKEGWRWIVAKDVTIQPRS